MYPKQRRFDTRCEKKLFVVSVEGAATEVEYLDRLGKLFYSTCIVDILRNVNKSSPCSVLERIRNHRCSLKPGDELWCVVDKDRWTDQQLNEIEAWATENSGGVTRYFGLSNPKIELWLLLHFMDWRTGDAIVPSLIQIMPEYDKHLVVSEFTRDRVALAITRGQFLTPDGKPPRFGYGSNIWVLAEHLQKSGSSPIP